jgi:oligoendopeptidase F
MLGAAAGALRGASYRDEGEFLLICNVEPFPTRVSWGMTLTWSDVEPRVRALLETDLAAAGVPDWLVARDAFDRDVTEAFAALYRAKDADTSDERAAAAFLTFVQEVQPHLATATNELDRKLAAVEGYRPPADLEGAFRDLHDRIALFHPEAIPLEVREAELQQRYGQVMGSVRVELDGERLTVTEARAKLDESDRDLRERAWRATSDALESVQPELDALFLELVRLRQQRARILGLPDYRELAWRERHRREYTPADALALHAAIAHEVVPHLRRITERRRARLGLDSVRPWDASADPDGAAALRPYRDAHALEEGLQRMFERIDPDFGAWFASLRDGWLDLAPRPNKVPGIGYQFYFPRSRAPFIYLSALGTDDDLVAMRHEAGHAFHSLATEARWPLLAHGARRPEANELAAEGMELLTLPYLAREHGGPYDDADARRSKRAQLERVVAIWVHVASVDAIQQWIYTQNPETLTAEAIDSAWLAITDDLSSGVDWTGLERARSKRWHISHLFTSPFYMLEYGLAFMGAVQVWRNSLTDRQEALASFKRFLALGGTVPLDRLYETAGARFAFDRDTMRELVTFVMAEWEATCAESEAF